MSNKKLIRLALRAIPLVLLTVAALLLVFVGISMHVSMNAAVAAPEVQVSQAHVQTLQQANCNCGPQVSASDCADCTWAAIRVTAPKGVKITAPSGYELITESATSYVVRRHWKPGENHTRVPYLVNGSRADYPAIKPGNCPTDTPTNTPTATNTKVATLTPTPTNSPTNTATATNTATPTNSPTATNTATNTATPTNTDTPTLTPTGTQSPTPTPTLTATPTATQLDTPTPTATNLPTLTPTATSTPCYGCEEGVEVGHGAKPGTYTEEQVLKSWNAKTWAEVPGYYFGEKATYSAYTIEAIPGQTPDTVRIVSVQRIANDLIPMDGNGHALVFKVWVACDSNYQIRAGDSTGRVFDASPVFASKSPEPGHDTHHWETVTRLPGGTWYSESEQNNYSGEFSHDKVRAATILTQQLQHIGAIIKDHDVRNWVAKGISLWAENGQLNKIDPGFSLWAWKDGDSDYATSPLNGQWLLSLCGRDLGFLPENQWVPNWLEITSSGKVIDHRNQEFFWQTLHNLPKPPSDPDKQWFCK